MLIATLVKKLRNGNKVAYTQLYHLYSSKLYAFAYKFLASDDLAQEVVHDVFVIVWEKRGKLDPSRSFDSFLFTIAKHKAVDLMHKLSREVEMNIDYCDTIAQSNHTAEFFVYNEIKKVEEQTVRNFPPRRKVIYRLSREENLSYEEIASKLGISKNSVKTHIKLALKELKQNISPVTDFTLFATTCSFLNFFL